MKHYEDYTVEMFLDDSYFRQWALGTLSKHDTFWENWIHHHPNKVLLIDEAKSLVIALRIKDKNIFSEDEIKNGIHDILIATSTKSKRKIWDFSLWIGVAASVSIMIGVLYFIGFKVNFFEVLTENIASKEAIHTNRSTKPISFQLADGSTIVLEPQSELRYGNDFGDTKREVFLIGEAFFNVQKNVQKPFIIYTEKLVTKVVGTSFSIRAFKDDSKILVSVKTGKVTVYKQEEKRKQSSSLSSEIMLIPNQQAVFEKKEEVLVKTLVDKPLLIHELPSNNSLDFRETKVSDIFLLFEHLYGVKLSFDKEVFAKCTITANLKNQNLYQQLDLICEIIQAKYEIVDGEILILGNGC
jgi:transmembrane sensor